MDGKPVASEAPRHTEPTHRSEPARDFRTGVKKVGLLIATVLVSVNIWTGSPLLALWVGSRLQGDIAPSMGAIFVVTVVLAALVIALTLTLSWLNARYDDMTGRPPRARQTSPWLRSMRGERETEISRGHPLSAVERVVVMSVVAAVLAFEVWFFFFAGSSLPNS